MVKAGWPEGRKGRMLRSLTRWIGYGLLAAAMLLGVVDGARSISASTLETTPLGTAVVWLFPRQFQGLDAFISRTLHPLLWDPVLLKLLLLPAAGVFFVVGGLCLILGRKPPEAALGG